MSATTIEGYVDASKAAIATAGSDYVMRKSRISHPCGYAWQQLRGCHRSIAAGDVHVQIRGRHDAARYCVSCARVRLGLRVTFRPGAITMTSTVRPVGTRPTPARRPRSTALGWSAV